MTYNFDPDLWYENHKAVLERKLKSGELSETRFKEELDDLDRRYREMWKRLDGYFQIPDEKE